jgi:hypothetical protein
MSEATARTETAPSTSPVTVLDARSLLRRVNATIVTLRRALSHDHADATFWAERGITAAAAQAKRRLLRQVANLLHVERASARRRIHGTRFATLEDQLAWLATMEDHQCGGAALAAELPRDATLAKLRAGMLHGPASL